jgi:hypothetical protein
MIIDLGGELRTAGTGRGGGLDLGGVFEDEAVSEAGIESGAE